MTHHVAGGGTPGTRDGHPAGFGGSEVPIATTDTARKSVWLETPQVSGAQPGSSALKPKQYFRLTAKNCYRNGKGAWLRGGDTCGVCGVSTQTAPRRCVSGGPGDPQSPKPPPDDRPGCLGSLLPLHEESRLYESRLYESRLYGSVKGGGGCYEYSLVYRSLRASKCNR